MVSIVTGERCENDHGDPCLSDPCNNDAQCSSVGLQVYCACADGFTAKYMYNKTCVKDHLSGKTTCLLRPLLSGRKLYFTCI